MDIGEPKRVIEITEPAVPYRGDPVPEKRPKPKRAPEKEPAKTRMRQVSASMTIDRERFDDLLREHGDSLEALAEAIRDRIADAFVRK